MYYLCSENKDTDQLHSTAAPKKVFAYAKSRFAHDTAHFIMYRYDIQNCLIAYKSSVLR